MPAKAQIDFIANTALWNRGIAHVQATLKGVAQRMEQVSHRARMMFLGATASVTGFIYAQQDEEKAIRAVELALKSQGLEVGKWSRHLQATASEIQRLTTTSDDAALKIMQLGLAMGISADQIEMATKAAIGLADTYGEDAGAAMEKISLAMQGQWAVLARIIPEIRNAKDDTERWAIINRKFAESWQVSQDVTGTAWGQIKQLKNAVGDLSEVIGAALIPSVTGMVERVRGLLEPLMNLAQQHGALIANVVLATTGVLGLATGLGVLSKAVSALSIGLKLVVGLVGVLSSPLTLLVSLGAAVAGAFAYLAYKSGALGKAWAWFKEVGEKMAGVLGKVWNWLVETGVKGFALLVAVIENWQDSLRAAFLGVAFTAVKVFEDLKHWLTKTVPAYLGWFARNWSSVFTDIAKLAATVFKNMWENIKGFFGNVWKWLKGEKTDWKWTGLTKGFESTIKEDLPKVAERVLTETEKWLAGEIAKSATPVYEAYQKRLEELRNKFGLGAAGPGAPAATAPEFPEEAGPGLPTAPPLPEETGFALRPEAPMKEEKEAQRAQRAGAAFEDVVVAFNRIAEAAASREKDAAERTAENTERIVRAEEEANQKQDRILNLLEQGVEIAKNSISSRAPDPVARFAR